MSTIKKLQRTLTWVMSIAMTQLAVPWAALAQQAPAHLDLGSTEATITVDSSHTQTANIKVGDQTVSVGAGSVVTPATYAAFLQAISSGGDHGLVLGSSGNAVGGTLQLTPSLSQNLGNLVVPTNVSLIHDFGGGSPLSLAGNLQNSGNFYAISTNSGVTNAVINATNIFNNQNALLTSVLPQGGLAGITGAVSNLSLTLNVINDVVNAGAITSAANLNITAGGSIINSLPAGVTGVNPVMQAVQNMNLTSQLGNIVNSGTLASITGNVNIASVNSLVVNSMGGRIEALAGNINIRDLLFDAKQNLNLTGGDWLSTQLNAFSGTGGINIDVDHLSGVLNTNSHTLKTIVREGNLNTGTIVATGDPFFGTLNGDHFLNGSIVTGGGPLAIVATGNVVANAPAINLNTDNGGGNGGDILISAGFRFSDAGGLATIKGDTECCGGSVLFDNGLNFVNSITAQGSGAGNRGGHLRIITKGGPLNAGTVNMAPAAINVSGNGGAAPGNVTIIADARPADVNSPVSITTGSITANGIATAPVPPLTFGNVTISTASVLLSTKDAGCNPCIQVDSNPVTGGAIQGLFTITPGVTREMSLSVGGPILTRGGNVALTAGRGVFVGGNIETGPANGEGLPGGNVTINVNTSTPFEIAAAVGTNRLAGFITTYNNLLGPGDSGNITINNNGTGGISVVDPARIGAFGNNGPAKGGAVTLNAGTGVLSIDNTANNALNVTGNLANGGSVTLIGERIQAIGPNAVRINAGAAGADGGAITFTQSGTTPVNIENAAGGFVFDTQGNNGGSVSVSAPALMTVDPTTGFNVNETVAGGKHGSVSFSTAGANPLADLRVSSPINAFGGGDGGSVTLTSGSARVFSVNGAGANLNGILGGGIDARGGGGAATNKGGIISISSPSGIEVVGANTLFAAGGAAAGDGGTVSLNVTGPNGITLSQPEVVNIGVTDGSGGSVTLGTANGPLTLQAGGTFTLNGAGVGARNGGTFNLNTQSISGNFNVLADGADTGTGGNISISTTGKNFVLSRGGAGNQTLARGGATSGNGGTITLSSANDLTVTNIDTDVTAQPLAAPGKGGIYSFTAGTAGQGNLQLTVPDLVFNANGLGAADGGSVTLVSSSASAFSVAGLANPNGFIGAAATNVNASAGATGKGGSVTVTNNGPGGIFSVQPTFFNVGATDGAGGSLTFNAPNGSIGFLGNDTFDVSGVGAGNNAGGTITINANNIAHIGGAALAVNFIANGINAGAGGGISITERDTVNTLTIDLGANNYTLQANGGATGGKGGDLTVSAGGGLSVNTASASAIAQGGDGAGGSYIFSSGTLFPANLTVTGAVNAAGIGNGAGGTVTFTSTADLFVNGAINAAGSGTGNGGKVTLTSSSTTTPFVVNNGVVANGINGAIAANGVALGEIKINSANGIDLSGPAGLNSFNLASTSGSGGKLTLNAGPGGVLTINLAPTNTLNLDAVAVDGTGGDFIVEAGSIVYAGGATLNVQASGFGNGGGGTFSVKTRDANFDLTAGPVGMFNVTARGGATEGNGGKITLESGRTLTIDMAGILATPQANGNGAFYTFRAGTSTTPADLLVTGTIDASAFAGANPKSGGTVILESTRDVSVSGAVTSAGAGLTGGAVTVGSHSPTVMNIGIGGTNAIVGGITTDGAGAGSITLTNTGVGGINLNPGLISMVSAEAGPTLTVTAANGAIFISGGILNVSGGNDKTGGTLTLTAQAIIPTGHVTLLANGGPLGGNAGTVTLNATGSASFLEIGTLAAGLNQFDIQANGLGTGGNGGTINLTAGGRIEIAGTNEVFPADYSLQVFPAAFATGGTINVTATGAAGGCCGSVLFLDPLTYSGATGPVRINISTNSPNAFIVGLPVAGNGVTGNINMDGGAGGDGGTLSINNSGSGGVQISPTATITARGGTGNSVPTGGGTVVITATAGTWQMSQATIDVSALDACGAGGTITLNLGTVVNAAGATGAMNLLANGGPVGGPSGLIGRGGRITVNYASTTSDLVFGPGVGQFNASATGGIKGGTAVLTAGRNITINPANFNIGQLNPFGGDAGSFTATAQNVFVNGNLNLNGSGIGDGGTVKITTTSGNAFFISPALAGLNGIRGTLQVNPGVTAGNGGTIELNLGSSLLQLAQGSTLSASATGTPGATGGVFNGGTIKISALQVGFLGGAGPITLQADAAGNGNGGTVDFSLTGGVLQIGGASGQFSFTARGGSAGSTFGNGGTLIAKAPNAVTVNNIANFNAGPQGTNGNGASLTLESGTGPIGVNAGVNVSGAGIGDGGKFTLRQTGSVSNAIGFGFAGANTILGAIIADAGATRGKGGEVRIETKGGSFFSGGYLIRANGAGANGDGGTIFVEAGNFQFVGAAVVNTFFANGSGIGKGGNISLRGLAGPVQVGNAGGQFSLTATGGSVNSFGGNGGTVSVLGQSLVVNSLGINANPLGLLGNGANLSFISTNQASFTGGITANAATQAGDGGIINVLVNNSNAFTISAAAAFNGVQGSLNANAGSVQGNGGSITVQNDSTGGGITIGNGVAINATASAAGGNGGNFKFVAKAPFTTAIGLNASGVGAGNGSTIEIEGTTITGPAAAPLTLLATGGNLGGNGGTVKVKSTSIALNGNLTVGLGAGQLNINVQPGTTAFGSANAGTIEVSAGNSLTVNPAALLANVPVGTANGNGGTVRLSANTANVGDLFISGSLDLSGRGVGNGGTIDIKLKGQNIFTVNPGFGGPSGVNGQLIANAGAISGKGGNIFIESRSPNNIGGVAFGAGQTLFVNSTGLNNDGGTVRVNAFGSSTVSLQIGFLGAGSTFLANGIGNGKGGEVNLTAGRFVFGTGNVSVQANGGVIGNGGKVTLRADGISGNGSDLTIGAAAGQFSVSATGGAANGIAGDGGEVVLAVGSISNNLTIAPASLLFGPQGAVGNGGTLTATSANNLFVNNGIGADGATFSGNGGTISFTSPGLQSASFFNIGAGTINNGVNGTLSASAGALSGNGGTINVTNTNANGFGIRFPGVQSVFANAGARGNGGTINLNAGPGNIDLNNLAGLTINPGFNGNGGNLSLSGRQIVFNAANNPFLSLQGDGVGSGGNITLVTTQAGAGNINIGIAAGTLFLDVRSLGAGDGGIVTANAAANLNVNANGLSLLNFNERGAQLVLSSGIASIASGFITTTGGNINTGLGSKSSITMTTNFVSNFITQAGGTTYLARRINLTSNQGLGALAAPVQVQASADPNSLSVTTSAGASAFLRQVNDPVTLGTVNVGNQFNLVSEGNLANTGVVTAPNNVTLSVLFGATLTVSNNITTGLGGTASLSTAGEIRQFNGVISGQTVNLTGTGGNDIGSSLARMTTSTTLLNVSTTGSAFIFNLKPLQMQTANVTNTLDILSCGNILFNNPVTANTLILGAFNADISASGPQLANVANLGVTFANNATFSGLTNPITILRSTVANTFTLSTSQAINVTNEIRGNRILLTSGFNQNISIGANLTGTGTNSLVFLSTGGAGNVLRTAAATISGTTAQFQSSTGSFGQPLGNELFVDSANIQINSSGNSAAFITRNFGTTVAQTLLPGNIGTGGFAWTPVDVGAPVTFSTFSSQGAFSISSGSTLTQNIGAVNSLNNGITIGGTTPGLTVTLNGTLQAGGNGTIVLSSAGGITTGNTFAQAGSVTVINGTAGAITQNANTTVSSNTGDVTLINTAVFGGMNLNGFIRTNVTGDLTIISDGSVSTRGLSTGSVLLAPGNGNDINVTVTNGGFTLQTNSFMQAGFGNITVNANTFGPGFITLDGQVNTLVGGAVSLNSAGAISTRNIQTGSQISPGGSLNNNDITITSANLTVITQPFANLFAGNNGSIFLTANGFAGSINVQGQMNALTGNINLTSRFFAQFQNVMTQTGSIIMTVTDGNLTQQANSIMSTNTGNIFLNTFGAGGFTNLLGNQVSVNLSGSIGINSANAVQTRTLSTGSLGPNPNNISVNAQSGGFTLLSGQIRTGNNGDITINSLAGLGNLNVQNGQVMTQQTGNINLFSQGAVNFGAVTTNTGSLTITAAGGNITQTAFQQAHTITGNITINSIAGSTVLNGFVRTLNSGTITVTASQNLTVQQVTSGSIGGGGANNITLTAQNGIFTLLGNGGFISSGQNGNITLNQGLAGQSMTLNGIVQAGAGTSNIAINSQSPLTINSNVFANNGFVTLNAQTGALTIGPLAIVQATNGGATGLQITTADAALGNVVVNGFVRTQVAGPLTINSAAGVTLNNFTLASGNLAITANNGAITTSNVGNIQVLNGTVALNAPAGGITLNAQLNKASGAGALDITAQNGLSVGGVLNIQGNINLTANSGLLLLRNGTGPIQTQNGNVTVLQNGLGAGDRILTQQGVIVNALSPTVGVGNIVFSVGNAAPPQAVGATPANVVVNLQNGGQVFFNAPVNGLAIVANAPQNNLTAKNATITFFIDAGSAFGAGAITLGGSNSFLADPPVPAGPVVVTPAIQSVGSPDGLSGQLLTPVVVPSNRSVAPAINGTTSMVPATELFEPLMPAGLVGELNAFRPSTAPVTGGSTVTPADVVKRDLVIESKSSDATEAGERVLTGGVEIMGRASSNSHGYVRANATAVVRSIDNDQLALESGEIVVSASRRSTVTAGRYTVDVAPGAIVQVARQGSVTKVRNLVDDMRSAVRLLIEGRAIKVGVGEEIVVGDDYRAVDAAMSAERIGRRNVKSFNVDDAHSVVRSEISLINLIGKNHLLASMYKGTSADRQVIERVMKMAACLFQVTSRKGAYSAYEAGATTPVNVKTPGSSTAVKVAQAKE